MRIISDDHFHEAVDIIHRGGIVAHATETCYGFACDLTNGEAVEKLFTLKHRPRDLPVSVLFSSVEEAKQWVEWNEKAEELARNYLPGPLTIVLPLRSDALRTLFSVPLPPTTYHLPPTLGVRISSHPVAQKLAQLAGVPLSTTSANLHRKPEPYSAAEILAQFAEQILRPDLILDSGVLPPTPPSTIVDLTGNAPNILRQGGTVL